MVEHPVKISIHNLLAAALMALATTLVTHAQTSAQLRAKYGEPLMTEVRDGRSGVERFLVRRGIQMTIRYTELGDPCEALIEPVPNSTPKNPRPEHSPGRDYMSTAEVIAVINEVLPVEKRGEKRNEFFVNGGDRAMRLHHRGCSGLYGAEYERASVTAASWCWGGTFSATIHWTGRACPGKHNANER